MFAAAGLVIGTRRGASNLAFEQEVHAGLAGILAAADEELDVTALNFEGSGGERAGRFVAIEKGVDQPVAHEAIDLHLIRQSALRRAGAERLAGDDPRSVDRAF